MLVFTLMLSCFPVQEPPQQQDQPPLMVAVRDANTGELRQPTKEEFIALNQHIKQKTLAPIQEIHRSDGTVTVRLNGRFMSYSVIVKREDGTSFEACIKNPENLPILKKQVREVPLEY